MLEAIQSFYDEQFVKLKEYLETNSEYSPYIFKEEPRDIMFPLVTFKNTNRNGTYTTLNYSDKKYTISFQINIFALTENGVAGRTVCDEISKLIEKYFTEEMKLNLTITPNASNLDEDVDRVIIYANGTLDTKYKDKIIVYPY